MTIAVMENREAMRTCQKNMRDDIVKRKQIEAIKDETNEMNRKMTRVED